MFCVATCASRKRRSSGLLAKIAEAPATFQDPVGAGADLRG
jgi:hypothetical protein